MAERSHTHVYSRSALTVWRAVPLCCNAMLAQRMRAQRASHTAARAEYHTLACPRSSARPSNHHIWSDIGLATQTTKTVVRGARGTCLQTTCEGRFQCVLGTTHRDRHHATGVVALARVSSPSRRNYEITASSVNLAEFVIVNPRSSLNRCFRRRAIQNISLTRPPANHFRRSSKCVHQGHVAICASSATHTATQTAQHGQPAHMARFGTLPSGGAPVDEDASSYGASQSEVAVGAE